jgi:tRNA G37 N-methylase Trm5
MRRDNNEEPLGFSERTESIHSENGFEWLIEVRKTRIR